MQLPARVVPGPPRHLRDLVQELALGRLQRLFVGLVVLPGDLSSILH